MAREGGDEGCIAVMLHEVRLVIAGEDQGKGGEIVIAQGKLWDWQGTSEAGWVMQGCAKVITCV